MSCQKLSRQSLHIALSCGRGSYSLTRMNVSTLFYPSTAEAEAPTAKKNGINIQPFMARSWQATSTHRPRRRRSQPTRRRSRATMRPRARRPREEGAQLPLGVELLVPPPDPQHLDPDSGAEAAGIGNPEVVGEVLHLETLDDDAHGGVVTVETLLGWRWLRQHQEFTPPDDNAFAVVDGTRICVSARDATYSFDTVALEWSKAGDWVLPFLSKAEHDAGLGLWLGLSAASPYDLCAVDLSAAAGDKPPPAVQRVGLDVYTQANWYMRKVALVNVGPGRFCTAKIFDVVDEQHGEYVSSVAVFTGVDVVPDDDDRQRERRLRMVKHRSECLATGTDSIECVL
uniref:Uncharacterized protein n=1 Tax=Setaria viridis TaxID=4556 RepID=A0A4U6V760_SETVI|nr:hypothetical protein SEVIR_3G030500v2 [Setaria viridis]